MFYLSFCEIVGENARSPPEGPLLNLVPLAGTHVLCPELPQEETTSGTQHPRRLAGESLAPGSEQVAGDVKGEDGIEAPFPEGQSAGVG